MSFQAIHINRDYTLNIVLIYLSVDNTLIFAVDIMLSQTLILYLQYTRLKDSVYNNTYHMFTQENE